ncbi:unnamed protein product [Prunus armeniaca]
MVSEQVQGRHIYPHSLTKRRSVTGCFGAGGVIRDPFGDWLAIEKGISSLIIEMDSAIAVNLCQNSSMLALHPLAALVPSWLSDYLVDDLFGIVHSRLVCLDQSV